MAITKHKEKKKSRFVRNSLFVACRKFFFFSLFSCSACCGPPLPQQWVCVCVCAGPQPAAGTVAAKCVPRSRTTRCARQGWSGIESKKRGGGSSGAMPALGVRETDTRSSNRTLQIPVEYAQVSTIRVSDDDGMRQDRQDHPRKPKTQTQSCSGRTQTLCGIFNSAV